MSTDYRNVDVTITIECVDKRTKKSDKKHNRLFLPPRGEACITTTGDYQTIVDRHPLLRSRFGSARTDSHTARKLRKSHENILSMGVLTKYARRGIRARRPRVVQPSSDFLRGYARIRSTVPRISHYATHMSKETWKSKWDQDLGRPGPANFGTFGHIPNLKCITCTQF